VGMALSPAGIAESMATRRRTVIDAFDQNVRFVGW
jgi:hypothetical protein